jgi:hypothetical protein
MGLLVCYVVTKCIVLQQWRTFFVSLYFNQEILSIKTRDKFIIIIVYHVYHRNTNTVAIQV